MTNLAEHPVTFLAVGGASTSTGLWALLNYGTAICGFVAAFCGALSGLFGLYLIYRKIKKEKTKPSWKRLNSSSPRRY